MILPSQRLAELMAQGVIAGAPPPLASQQAQPYDALPTTLQPASIDLRLGRTAYRMRASFLPGADKSVQNGLDALCLHSIDITDGAVLETGCIYLIPIMESLDLSGQGGLSAIANPKSSTGRLDVFARLIGNGSTRFDALPSGYAGPLWLEVAPRTFPVLVRPGDRLSQLRIREGEHAPLSRQTVSIDLSADGSGPIGYRARRHSGMVDLRGISAHRALDYWEPVRVGEHGLILEPEEFYILRSREAVEIPIDQAAEMAPIDTEIGEFRAHYAGFFDPGFGVAEQGGSGSRAVLEVRGRDVPFLLSDGQPVAHLVFEAMSEVPAALYGDGGSSYQAQGLRLSKHFAS